MERYNEYKDSGVQWLGEIPSHWDMLALKHILKLRKKLVGKQSYKYDLLSLTLQGIIKRDIDNPTGKFPSSFDTYQEVNAGDFVFCNFDNEETPRAVGLSEYKGMITGAYDVLSCKNSNLTNRYLIYYFLYIDDAKRFKPLYKGLRKTVPFDSFMSYKIPVPSIEEQQAIAFYLDTATAKIDEAIAQQQKMIDLLNERKQIIINNAVTKGLNPDAPMKDSGVEWIGEIPEHWEVMKLKHVTSKIGSGSTPRGGAEVYQDSGIMFLRSQNVYNDGLKLDDVAHIVDGVHQKMKGTQVKYNDILYNITGGSIGRCCCYDREDEANVNQHVSIVRPKGIIAKYLMYNLQSDNAQRQLRETLKGGNREGLAAVTFKEFLILTCPKEEQNQIVSHIERMFVNIDRAISNATKQISLLQERKQIIINDVVTGKVKVS